MGVQAGMRFGVQHATRAHTLRTAPPAYAAAARALIPAGAILICIDLGYQVDFCFGGQKNLRPEQSYASNTRGL